MSAVYNENDPAAAAWLRELIATGEIASGDVDERSIKDVRADDYRGYTQVHCFAGIGIWPGAFRAAGWDDDHPVGSGSCPCQGFSAAGKGLGFNDPRHLWPDWFRLIDEAREQGQPWVDTLFIEQVATANEWLDLVQSDLEARDFAVAATDIPAAGFGQGAHIRQRFYGVADRHNTERWADLAGRDFSDWPQAGRIEGYGKPGAGVAVGGMGHHHAGPPLGSRGPDRYGAVRVQGPAAGASGALLGCDWLFCHDARIRPVEAGTFPLAASNPGRLGKLRGFGNALDFETAVNFIGAYMEAADIRDVMAEMT